MSNIIPYNEISSMAKTVCESKLFGVKTPTEAITIMLLAQSEGLHPMQAIRDYDIIQGKPALKSKAKLARFQRAGGIVKFISRSDIECEAEFSHPSCPTPIIVKWDMKTASAAGLGTRDMWKKYPRQMLSARVISEGVDACFPDAGGLVYTPEEISDFDLPRGFKAPLIEITEDVPVIDINDDIKNVEPKEIDNDL